MESFENKSLALLRIKEILENYSDSEHRLSQVEIIDHLRREYELDIDRKTVRRNLSKLAEAGLEVETVGKTGTYLNRRTFENSELRLLTDAVLDMKDISLRQTKDLVNKINSLGNVYFRKSQDADKVLLSFPKDKGNSNLFYHLDLINEAIAKNQKLQFNYHDAEIVTPYRAIVRNGRYHLLAYDERKREMRVFRLSFMTDLVVLPESGTALKNVQGYEQGLNYARIYNMPEISAEMPIHAVFEAESAMRAKIEDQFGKGLRILETVKANDESPQGKIRVSLEVSPKVLIDWALQHMDTVEIKTPASIRKDVLLKLYEGLKKYKKEA